VKRKGDNAVVAVLLGVGVLVAILCWAAFQNMPIDQPGTLAVIAGLVAGVGAGYVVHNVQEERERKRDPELFAIKQAALAKEIERHQRRLAADQKKRQEKHTGKWDSVSKVKCPHCQEVGKVEKFVPPEQDTSPDGLLKAGMKGHLLNALGDDLWQFTEEAQIESVQKANRKREIPNMRCSNCTVEWRV
jgi:hypothetical protein